ncbi:heavy metal-binding domain-containing protein [Dactylosporangium sp. NPDC051541]|uniref:heavy metal-binding domain-containing protein n=1 Tax=Dactylosporangium sp. NPDC051541 TaxID=3363977 RepID=UPI003789A9FB
MTLDPAELGVPQDALDRLDELKPGKPGRIFTSDLTVNEFLLVKQAGFTPLGLVLGTSVYHCGFQFGRWAKNAELDVLSQAMYHARELAMTRMQAEAALLGADGIVAVRLAVDFKEWGNDTAEFLAVGTAVKADDGADWKPNTGRPFTSDLSGQDFWTLLQAGYAPLGMVMGVCVYHVARRTLGNVLSSIGRNVELPQFTQALYEARELAMARMQHEAEQLDAEGIVGVDLTQRNHSWGSHTTEFFAIGTAVRPIRAEHTIPVPQLIMGLD